MESHRFSNGFVILPVTQHCEQVNKEREESFCPVAHA